jgi:hypothetical protein
LEAKARISPKIKPREPIIATGNKMAEKPVAAIGTTIR